MKDGPNGYDPLGLFYFMKSKSTTRFVRLDYSILAIKEITSTDKIVLAYNWGDWGKGGYFATNKYAAGVLSMNIKTFEKSALKLKTLGLWKVRGVFVEPNAAPTPVGSTPTPVGAMPTRVGSSSTPVGFVPTPVGIESAILPLKTGVLLDNLLDNKLEKDKIEVLENAGEAAEPKIKDVSSNNFKDFKETIQKKLDPKNIKESRYLDSDSNKVKKIDPSKYDFSSYKIFDAEGVPILQGDMVKANYHASMEGLPKPYSKEDIRTAPSTPLAFISLADKKFFEESLTHEQSASAAKVVVATGS